MRKIRKNSLKILSAAILACSFCLSTGAKEVYPGVDVPDEVYNTEYGDKENYSEIKYYKWTTDENGVKTLENGTADDNDLKYYVSSQKENISDISGVITENQNGGDINANFIDLTLTNNTNAIKNAVDNEIGNITGDYVNTSINSVIDNNGKINNIDITAINNKGGTASKTSAASVIANTTATSEINEINGVFIGNSNKSAISNNNGGNINSIKGIFIGNSIGKNWGAAIANNAGNFNFQEHIGTIEGVFIDNYSQLRGGAIANGGIIDSIKGVFINNRADSEGAAIWQYGVVGSIEGYFEGNTGAYAIRTYTRQSIPEEYDYNIKSIKGIFKDNPVGAIWVSGQSVKDINGEFINNGIGVKASWYASIDSF